LFGGIQAYVDGQVSGAIIGGLASHCGDMTGVQISGIINKAKSVKGVQLGCVNIAKEGLQFGLLNYNEAGFLKQDVLGLFAL